MRRRPAPRGGGAGEKASTALRAFRLEP